MASTALLERLRARNVGLASTMPLLNILHAHPANLANITAILRSHRVLIAWLAHTARQQERRVVRHASIA